MLLLIAYLVSAQACCYQVLRFSTTIERGTGTDAEGSNPSPSCRESLRTIGSSAAESIRGRQRKQGPYGALGEVAFALSALKRDPAGCRSIHLDPTVIIIARWALHRTEPFADRTRKVSLGAGRAVPNSKLSDQEGSESGRCFKSSGLPAGRNHSNTTYRSSDTSSMRHHCIGC
jgi:hypothetical protein